MRRRPQPHTGRRQRRHLAHEAARRRKRKAIDYIERLKAQLIPSPRMLNKATAKRRMLEAIAEEREAAAKLRLAKLTDFADAIERHTGAAA